MLSELVVVDESASLVRNADGSQDAKLGCERDRARAGVRELFNSTVETLSEGMCSAMRWTPQGYAQVIVVKCHLKVVGWPADIPFCNLSKIGGGIRSLQELHRLWHLPENAPERLRFEPADEDDRAAAAGDPLSVHPNRAKLEEALAKEREKAAREGEEAAVVVQELVLHPADLAELAVYSIVPGSGRRRRRQRSDVKKRRRRRKNAGEGPTTFRLPKRGVTSREFVLAGDEGGPAAESGSESGERAAKRARMDLAVDDPIDRFVFLRQGSGSA